MPDCLSGDRGFESHQSCIKTLFMIALLLIINFVLGILAYIIALCIIYQETGKLTLMDFLVNIPVIIVGIISICCALIKVVMSKKE